MPTNDLSSLRSRLNRRMREGRVKWTTIRKNLALRKLLELIEASPVDTGKLVSNWQASLNFANTSVREAYAEGSKGDATAESNRGKAYFTGETIIERGTSATSIHISNFTPYLPYNATTFDLSSPDPGVFVDTNIDLDDID